MTDEAHNTGSVGRPRQPFVAVLRAQGRSQAWLARVTGYSRQHVKNVASGRFQPGPRFRAAVAAALGLAERDLFVHGDSNSPPAEPVGTSNGRAGSAVGDPLYRAGDRVSSRPNCVVQEAPPPTTA